MRGPVSMVLVAALAFATACQTARDETPPPNVEALRENMRQAIWGHRDLPHSAGPLSLRRNISTKHFVDVPNLASIDELTFAAGLGLESVVYHLHPHRNNGYLVLYQEGHGDGFLAIAQTTLNGLVEKGFAVMAFDMPLTGLNAQNAPAVVLPDGSRYVPSGHNDLKRAEAAGAQAMAPFFTPLAAAIDHIVAQRRYKGIAMVGLSGGGWATHVYAAMDPRVELSYPVAGHVSNELKQGEKGPGDFEQNLDRPLYRVADFESIFFLGAAGQGRSQLQILNKYDTCCFWTRDRWPLFERYERRIQTWLEAGPGGHFEIHEDATHRGHRISAHALNVIRNDLHARWKL